MIPRTAAPSVPPFVPVEGPVAAPAASSPAPVAPRDQLEAAPAAAALAIVAAPRSPARSAFPGLAAAVEEAQAAARASGDGPPDPVAFEALRARLRAAREAFPAAYQQAVIDPLLRTLDRLGPGGFARLLAQDPEREGEARLLLDVAQAVLQRGEGYQARATAAFQEVVSDLYAGFLSAEDRRGVKPPDHGVVPPLVRWGSADAGPYTWPAPDTATIGVKGAVVSLPAANASAGLLAWPALAHETAGHDLLEADEGLRDELSTTVREHLLAEGMGQELADYWADRIDETASDVLGVLNMGPAAAIGLVGYFRALNGAWSGKPALRNVGPAGDPHPADLARAYLGAETVRLLAFDGAPRWADRITAEADRDLGTIRLGGVAVTAGVAKASAAIVARTIVQARLAALDGHAFGEIQNWSDRDEAIVAALRKDLRSGAGAGRYVEGAYAAHAVAAGVYEAIGGTSDPGQVMDRMVAVLADMNAHDPAWVPAGGARAQQVA